MFRIRKIWLLHIIIFFAAFLLFQIELIIAKILLLKFGGSYTVWGAALVFFQATLLLGYLYVHYVIQKFGVSRYRRFHLCLLFLTLLFFPGRPLPAIYAQYQAPLVINVFWQLLRSIGPVFFVLSTTSIIFQSWLTKSELAESSNPYALYAVSNLGSFAGLLSYPFLFEAYLGLDKQLVIWRIIYFAFLALHLIAFKLIGVKTEEAKKERIPSEIGFKEKFSWLLFSSSSVIMNLSVTNIITYEIAPIPVLWVLPLCIYLISFVFNFKQSPWCPRWIKDKFHLTIGYGILFFFLTLKRILPIMIVVTCHLILLFIICMFCANELHKRKPPQSHNLTLFYLIIATGGLIGGFLVSWIIPLISASMIEYLIGLFLICLVFIIEEKKSRIDPYRLRLMIFNILLLLLWPIVFRKYNVFGIFLIVIAFQLIYSEFRGKYFTVGLSLATILFLSPVLDLLWSANFYIFSHRNYYGIYKIYEKDRKMFLLNGTTVHGGQYLVKEKEMEPIAYYHKTTPFGKIFTSDLFHFKRIGVIGLGTGTIAAYGKKDCVIDFFELDPDVFGIANQYFTYLKKSPSKINYIFGDARISLISVPDKKYELLIVDAFSGDSIPIHLLTLEAIKEYQRCVSDKGLILFHISNRYVDLVPVLFSNARALHLYACINSNQASKEKGEVSRTLWFALTGNLDTFQKLTAQLEWRESTSLIFLPRPRPWTDQYSNVLPALEIEKLLTQIKEFQPLYWDSSLSGL